MALAQTTFNPVYICVSILAPVLIGFIVVSYHIVLYCIMPYFVILYHKILCPIVCYCYTVSYCIV